MGIIEKYRFRHGRNSEAISWLSGHALKFRKEFWLFKQLAHITYYYLDYLQLQFNVHGCHSFQDKSVSRKDQKNCTFYYSNISIEIHLKFSYLSWRTFKLCYDVYIGFPKHLMVY